MLVILPEFESIFKEKVAKGKEIAKEKKIAFLGLCRNVSDCLEKNVHTMNSLGLESVKFYVYENDSKDGTQDVLKKLSESKDLEFNYKSETLNRVQYGTVKNTDRVTKLAEYRNHCLEYAKQNFSEMDYICVIDLDFMDFSTDGFYHTISYMEEDQNIDAMAGFSYEPKQMNGIVFAWNYDCWAFRWHNWEDTAKYYDERKFSSMLWFGFWQPLIGSPPIAVNSAFGGYCVYKTDKFLKGQYTGEDCEHVTFHKSLKDNNDSFQLYANPAQTLLFPSS
jgi:hypothetical protein